MGRRLSRSQGLYARRSMPIGDELGEYPVPVEFLNHVDTGQIIEAMIFCVGGLAAFFNLKGDVRVDRVMRGEQHKQNQEKFVEQGARLDKLTDIAAEQVRQNTIVEFCVKRLDKLEKGP